MLILLSEITTPFKPDPYGAREFVKRWASENGQFGVESYSRLKQKSIPLQEFKKLAEDRLLYFDEQMMSLTW